MLGQVTWVWAGVHEEADGTSGTGQGRILGCECGCRP